MISYFMGAKYSAKYIMLQAYHLVLQYPLHRPRVLKLLLDLQYSSNKYLDDNSVKFIIAFLEGLFFIYLNVIRQLQTGLF